MAHQPLNIGEYSVYLEETTSTNDALKLLFSTQQIPEGAVVYTHFQTNGRGQQNSVWESEPGKNLLFSVLLKPHFLLAIEQVWLNIIISLALRDTTQEFCPNSVKIKWPNDIYCQEKKLAGILIENVLQGNRIRFSVIGMGLNLNQQEFNEPKAASIYTLSGVWVEPKLARELLCQKLGHYYALLLGKQHTLLWDLYHQHLLGKGEMAIFKKDSVLFEAQIMGIDKKGRLHLLVNDEIESYANKEVEFINLIKN